MPTDPVSFFSYRGFKAGDAFNNGRNYYFSTLTTLMSSDRAIVILHGLNGHPEETWKHKSQFFWPWELHNHVEGARVMVYGYNADVAPALAENLIRLKGLAQNLLDDLIIERQEEKEQTRPLIFMGHSLGGLVVKKAIHLASQEVDNKLSDKRLIYQSTKALFFFGTPHLGSRAGEEFRVQLLQRIAKVAFVKVPPELESVLRLHSHELSDLTDDFKKISLWRDGKLEIYTYYESVSSAKLGKLAVDETSAKIGYNDENTRTIQADHEGMVKFMNETDSGFRSVYGNVRGLVRRQQQSSQEVTASGFYVPSYPAHCISPVKSLIPRGKLLRQVREQLLRQTESCKSRVTKVGIWGPGGTGKSQLARSYVQEYGDQYNATFFIQAGDLALIEQNFLEIYYSLPDPMPISQDVSAEKVRVAVLTWFAQHQGKWLLVFDEADSLDQNSDKFVSLLRYFPRGPEVHIVITSRSSLVKDLSTFDGVEIFSLEVAEAVELFFATANINRTKEAKDQVELIVHDLGYLPLLISMAGSYVSQTPRLATDLSQFLEEHRIQLLHQEPQSSSMYDKSMVATWEKSYLAVFEQSPDACQLFILLGFLSHEDIYSGLIIPVSALTKIPQSESPLSPKGFQESFWNWRFSEADEILTTEDDRVVDTDSTDNLPFLQPWTSIIGLQENFNIHDLEACFSLLERHSMIQRSESGESYAVHSLVHAWCRDEMSMKTSDGFKRFSLAILQLLFTATSTIQLEAITDEESGRQKALRLVPHLGNGLQAIKRTLIHLADDSGISIALRYMTQFLKRFDCWREASSLLKIIVERSQASVGDRDPMTIGFMIELAVSLLNQIKPDEAVKIASEAAEKAQLLEGEHSIKVEAKKALEIVTLGLTRLRTTASTLSQTLNQLKEQVLMTSRHVAILSESKSGLERNIEKGRETLNVLDTIAYLTQTLRASLEAPLQLGLECQKKLDTLLDAKVRLLRDLQQLETDDIFETIQEYQDITSAFPDREGYIKVSKKVPELKSRLSGLLEEILRHGILASDLNKHFFKFKEATKVWSTKIQGSDLHLQTPWRKFLGSALLIFGLANAEEHQHDDTGRSDFHPIISYFLRSHITIVGQIHGYNITPI